MAERTVLIVDDDAVIREVAKVALEVVGGWRVLLAESGPEGQQVAAREQPDAVLLDVMMPEVDGPQSAAELAADPQTATIPVVFLTAKGWDPGREDETLAAGNAAGVIAKPFDPMALSRQISQLLGWREE